MTVEELYQSMGADYDSAKRVLRVDRLIDKHIRRLPGGGVVDGLIAAGHGADPQELFERAHAAKGVCGNLGLTELAKLSSRIAEEFRPGNPRTMSDDEVAQAIARIEEIYALACSSIEAYVTA